MNAKVELHPNLFEITFNCVLIKLMPKRADSTKIDQLNGHLKFRIDDEHAFDKTLGIIKPITGLQSHNIPSVDDWFHSVSEDLGGVFPFDKKFTDHQIKVKAGGKIISHLTNCEIAGFKLKTGTLTCIEFDVLALDIKSESHLGKLGDVMMRNVNCAISRSPHWAEQKALELDEKEKNKGDADKQEDLTEKQKQEIERAKEKANKRNTNKARGRGSKTDA